ncbi:MAG: hypothetical protein U5K75_01475 [Ahrensia sp.]|nr:hypothetical protein [Ahrensia sp.]
MATGSAAMFWYFRWRATTVSKHLAIATSADKMIHAYERHDVRETTIVPQWQRRISGVFRFPDFQET